VVTKEQYLEFLEVSRSQDFLLYWECLTFEVYQAFSNKTKGEYKDAKKFWINSLRMGLETITGNPRGFLPERKRKTGGLSSA
jgi:hypothetical protein